MKLTIYRVFSFLLLPMAILFSIFFLLFLRAAFANPLIFLPLFFIGCISIYTFASFNFLIRGIDGGKLLGRSSKDWLIANAIVSLVYVFSASGNAISLLLNSNKILVLAKQAKENAGDALKATEAQMVQFINAVCYFTLAYNIILFIHILLSFQYIKKYGYLFQRAEGSR